jgi:hypothetical protein
MIVIAREVAQFAVLVALRRAELARTRAAAPLLGDMLADEAFRD